MLQYYGNNAPAGAISEPLDCFSCGASSVCEYRCIDGGDGPFIHVATVSAGQLTINSLFRPEIA
jgi:hypothetical protein